MKDIKRVCYIVLCIIIASVTLISCGKNDGTSFVESPKSYGFTGDVEGVSFVLDDLGTEVSVKNSTQKSFLKLLNKHKTEEDYDENDFYANVSYYDEIRRYAGGVSELSIPAPVALTWSAVCDKRISSYEVSIYDKNDISNVQILSAEEPRLEIYNLKIATSYIWSVTAVTESGRTTSGEACFVTADEQPRGLYVDGVTNFRDVGGYKTEQGQRVKQGLLYRCAALNDLNNLNITSKGLDTLIWQLGIKTEIDLRCDGDECGNISEGYLGVDIEYKRFPMGFTANAIFDNADKIKDFFDVLSQESNYPLLFHCVIGTDRTGMMSFLINGLLGVSVNDLYLDYAWSNFGNIGSSRSPEIVRNNYIQLINTYDGETFADKVYNFLESEIGIETSVLNRVRAILLG